ncbi:MAG: prepilin-type N-terminal cleavage/methylation domain-containing protein [Candidatus Saccharicenans sp.]|nr:prepilin-type N-terminal cleavage/methylation domain-containing protein [Candidatus Saccharicenans sp.]
MDINYQELNRGVRGLNPRLGQNKNKEDTSRKEYQEMRLRASFPISTDSYRAQGPRKLAPLSPSVSFSLVAGRRRISIVVADRLKDKITTNTDRLEAGQWLVRGFSLIETLIAMAIVFFLLVGLAQMFCYSLLLKQKADLHQASVDLISRKIELLKGLEPENEALWPGVHQETIQDSNSGRLFLLTWEVSETQDKLKKIQVSLYPLPFGSRPPVRACWLRSELLGF